MPGRRLECSQGVHDSWGARETPSGRRRLVDGPWLACWWPRLSLRASRWYSAISFQRDMWWPGASLAASRRLLGILLVWSKGGRLSGGVVSSKVPLALSGLFRERRITLGELASTAVKEPVQS